MDRRHYADDLLYVHRLNKAEEWWVAEFMESYRILSGSESQLHQVKEQLISYKFNSFGFTGLIHSRDFDPSSDIRATTPSLEEIMIYFARKEDV